MKARRRATKGRRDIGRQIAEGMFRVVDRHYDELLDAAKKQWEHSHAESDPSDARVRVRIHSGRRRALSGVTKNARKRSVPHGKSSVASATS